MPICFIEAPPGIRTAAKKTMVEKITAAISIGAINSAIIAGNAPEDRVTKLREFWNGCATKDGASACGSRRAKRMAESG
jgi:predicted acylesterase/phospholipase RssA